MAGGALLLGGGLMTALPKVMEFRQSMKDLAEASPRAASGIGKVAKAAGAAAAAFVALQIVAAVFSEKNVKTAEDYGQAILKVAKASDAAGAGKGLDSIFTKFDKFANMPISNIDNMADAVKRLSNQTFNDSGNKFFEGFTNLLGLPKGEIGQLEDRLRGLGESMGDLARNGAADTAAKTFQALTKEFEKNGKGAKEALESVPGYKDALLGLATQAGVTLEGQDLLDFAMGKIPKSMQGASTAVETYTSKTGEAKPVTEAMAKALEEVGLSAAGAITDIDAFGKSLFAAGLLSLSASDAAIAVQDAIDKVTESVKKNGTTLDINTEQGRANQSAFNGLASASIASAEATAKETLATQGSAAAQAQLQGSLSQSYADLIRAAGQFGITGDAADTMARKALGIPKNVNIDAWIADHASATLEGIKGKADGLDGRQVTMTIIERNIRTIETQVKGGSDGFGDDPSMTALRRATGGRVYGPGTTTSDSIPTWLSKDEYVLKASAAKAIGYQNLDRLNGADTQPLKAGFQYSPAAAPARQSAAATESVRSSGVSVGQINISQVDDPIGTSHAVNRRLSALAV